MYTKIFLQVLATGIILRNKAITVVYFELSKISKMSHETLSENLGK